MAARIFAPKMTSVMASATFKVVRPMLRSNVAGKRVFSGLTTRITPLKPLAPPTKLTTLTPRIGRRAYSSEIAQAMVEVSQNIGMGSAAIGLSGAGVGIGLVFAALVNATARNPSIRTQLFSYAILGFAFVEAIGLFDLMVAMMAKFL